jgi:CDP-diacylglycerol--glycerol-3-phosphate 3-phosphatidyltransferase
MVVVSILGIIGAFLTSYTRARAEALGIDAKVGLMQRPERVTLLSAPQAFFGLTLDGYVLMLIVTLLAVTSWITAVQRMAVRLPRHAPDRPGRDARPRSCRPRSSARRAAPACPPDPLAPLPR